MPKSKTTDTEIASSQDDMAALRTQLEQMTARATTAEHTAAEATRARRTAELSTMSAQERELVSAQEATDARLEALESEATDLENRIAVLADEPGNGREIAKLTRELTQATTKIDGETRKKEYLATQREKVTTTNKTAREAAPAEGAKVLANGLVYDKLNRETQQWADKNPQIFTDVRFAKRATIAAQEAIEVEGLKDNSPEFFEFIEGKLGLKAAAEDNQDEPEDEEGEDIAQAARESYTPEKPQRPAAGPGALSSAAPPTRQTPAVGGGGNRRTLTLNADEREVADALYASLPNAADRYVKYAANKKVMQGRTNTHFRN